MQEFILDTQKNLRRLGASLEGMLQYGNVVKLDEDAVAVQAQFPDRDNVVSDWLKVIVRGSLEDKEFWMPALNDRVACVFESNVDEIHSPRGICLGCVYEKQDAAPEGAKGKRLLLFKDGTRIEYDRENHRLHADVKGDVEVVAEKTIKAKAKAALSLSSDEAIIIKAPKFIVETDSIDVKATAGEIEVAKVTHTKHRHLDSMGSTQTPTPGT